MKITALRIINYKGFLDSGFVELNGSWNVVVGQNNAGKTAFMEGFRLARNEHRPHRNITMPRGFPLPQLSRFGTRMIIGREWLKNAWLAGGGYFELPSASAASDGRVREINAEEFWNGPDLNVEIEFSPGQSPRSEWPSHGLFEAIGDQKYVQFHPSVDRRIRSRPDRLDRVDAHRAAAIGLPQLGARERLREVHGRH